MKKNLGMEKHESEEGLALNDSKVEEGDNCVKSLEYDKILAKFEETKEKYKRGRLRLYPHKVHDSKVIHALMQSSPSKIEIVRAMNIYELWQWSSSLENATPGQRSDYRTPEKRIRIMGAVPVSTPSPLIPGKTVSYEDLQSVQAAIHVWAVRERGGIQFLLTNRLTIQDFEEIIHYAGPGSELNILKGWSPQQLRGIWRNSQHKKDPFRGHPQTGSENAKKVHESSDLYCPFQFCKTGLSPKMFSQPPTFPVESYQPRGLFSTSVNEEDQQTAKKISLLHTSQVPLTFLNEDNEEDQQAAEKSSLLHPSQGLQAFLSEEVQQAAEKSSPLHPSQRPPALLNEEDQQTADRIKKSYTKHVSDEAEDKKEIEDDSNPMVSVEVSGIISVPIIVEGHDTVKDTVDLLLSDVIQSLPSQSDTVHFEPETEAAENEAESNSSHHPHGNLHVDGVHDTGDEEPGFLVDKNVGNKFMVDDTTQRIALSLPNLSPILPDNGGNNLLVNPHHVSSDNIHLEDSVDEVYNLDENLIPLPEVIVIQDKEKKTPFQQTAAQCPACNQSFKTMVGLERHIRVKHRDNEELINTKLAVTCGICKVEVRYLNTHMRDKHPDKTGNWCDVCSTVISSNFSLHRAQCIYCIHPSCQYKSKRKGRLLKHIAKCNFQVKNKETKATPVKSSASHNEGTPQGDDGDLEEEQTTYSTDVPTMPRLVEDDSEEDTIEGEQEDGNKKEKEDRTEKYEEDMNDTDQEEINEKVRTRFSFDVEDSHYMSEFDDDDAEEYTIFRRKNKDEVEKKLRMAEDFSNPRREGDVLIEKKFLDFMKLRMSSTMKEATLPSSSRDVTGQSYVNIVKRDILTAYRELYDDFDASDLLEYGSVKKSTLRGSYSKQGGERDPIFYTVSVFLRAMKRFESGAYGTSMKAAIAANIKFMDFIEHEFTMNMEKYGVGILKTVIETHEIVRKFIANTNRWGVANKEERKTLETNKVLSHHKNPEKDAEVLKCLAKYKNSEERLQKWSEIIEASKEEAPAPSLAAFVEMQKFAMEEACIVGGITWSQFVNFRGCDGAGTYLAGCTWQQYMENLKGQLCCYICNMHTSQSHTPL